MHVPGKSSLFEEKRTNIRWDMWPTKGKGDMCLHKLWTGTCVSKKIWWHPPSDYVCQDQQKETIDYTVGTHINTINLWHVHVSVFILGDTLIVLCTALLTLMTRVFPFLLQAVPYGFYQWFTLQKTLLYKFSCPPEESPQCQRCH